jgi:O-antigen/teichoic acid export membrane protein
MALSAQVAAIALVCLAAVVLLGQTVRRFGGAPEASFPKGEVPSTAGLVGLGLPLMLVQLLAFVIQQGDLWMVQWSCTLQEVGLYNAARRLLLVAAMPVQISMFSVLSTIPDLAARGKLVELERVLRSASTLTAVVALPVLVLLLLVPGAALTLLFGDSYGEAVGPLIVLSLGYVVMVLLGNPIHVLTMTGRHRAALAINLGCGIALVVGAILAGRYCGLLGIAAAVSASLTFQSAAAWWTVRCQIGVRTHVGWMARN